MFTQMTDIGGRTTNYFYNSPVNNYMPTVLIVEDDEDNRELLRVLLEIWNYRVVEAVNGIEALNLAEQVSPDLILMDVKLPLLDGLEATREIRKSANIGSVPIVFLSGCAEAKFRNAANEVGANAYLVKPLDYDNLQTTIAEQIVFPRNT